MPALVAFRKAQGLSQKQMAATIGVSASMYEKVESGLRNMTYGFICKLKAAYPDADLNIFFNN